VDEEFERWRVKVQLIDPRRSGLAGGAFGGVRTWAAVGVMSRPISASSKC
jgi:hypothetical protein